MPGALRPLTRALLGALVVLAAGSPAALGATLTAGDPSGSARFGSAVELSSDGTRALVGNQYRASAPSGAYVFDDVAGTWSQSALLIGSDATASDLAGRAVALSADGTVAVVGAQNHDSGGIANAGAAYVFERDVSGTWSETAKLEPPDTAAGSFGGAVAISDDGTRLVIGAPCSGTSCTGAAYFYERGSGGIWTGAGSISGLSQSALLGRSVAISGDGTIAAIGQQGYNYRSGSRTVYQSSVLTFTRSSGGSWTYSRTLYTPRGTVNDGFGGAALELDGTGSHLLVGAPSGGTIGGSAIAGRAYLYSRSGTTWTTATTFTEYASNSCEHGYAGDLSADATSLVITMPSCTTSYAYGSGVAIRWTRSSGSWRWSWVSVGGLDPTASFGYAAALDADGSRVAIGALAQTTAGFTNAGAVYAW